MPVAAANRLPGRTGALVLALLSATFVPPRAHADEPCRDAAGQAAAPVAYLVSITGTVTVNGAPPTGEAPGRPVCAGAAVAVGPAGRALVSLVGADTPLRLDENTVSRFEAPAEPGSGLVELVRGGLYFLSEVRRTLTVRTPYVNAGVEGTEVYLRVADAGTEMIVLEGQVAATPGSASAVPFAATPVVTGQRLAAAAGAVPAVTALPDDGAPFGVLRRVTVGALSWTLYYPEVLVGPEVASDPRLAEAARLLVAGQRDQAEAALAQVPDAGLAGGLAAALRTSIAVARGDAAGAEAAAARAVALAPAAAAPRLAQSYARQLALDLDGAVAAAAEAVDLAPQEALPQARLAELHLMQGDVRRARAAADAATRLGSTPLTAIVQGFADLATYRAAEAETAFRRALAQESQNPSALLGLGLAQIRRGDLAAGTTQLQNAAAADPGSSLLRSYLGKAYFTARDEGAAAKQYAIAKELDPTDPTPWFYDAIRLQLANQPVAALRAIDRSIALNDDRAPFRSRLLLDRDQATRGASLAQIYQDLGFTRLGINEASRALALDPSSSSAHRFLSDVYQGEPRLEAARVSELLQAQLLQPVGMNPVQPSLGFPDLNVIANAGPAHVSFNEFTPLFQEDGWQLNGTGVVGTQNTIGNELTATALWGRTSISLGQYYFDTDGFRRNDHLQHKIYTAFAQVQATDNLSLQAEYRRRETNTGDRSQNFDPDDFDRFFDDSIDQDLFRLGGKLDLSPATSVILSAVHGNLNQRPRSNTPFVTPVGTFDFTTRTRDNQDGNQLEGQVQSRHGPARLVAGGGVYRIDEDFSQVQSFAGSEFEPITDPHRNTEAERLYGYGFIDWPEDTILTVGMGVVRTDSAGRRETEPTPKLGVAYRATDRLTLRGAAFRTVKSNILVQQTIEPTVVAGFNQLFDDVNGTKANQAGLGADLRLTEELALGAQILYRDISSVLLDADDAGGSDLLLEDANEFAGEAYLYWTPTDRISVSLELWGSRFRFNEDDATYAPKDIDSLRAPLSVRYFHPSGFFAAGGVQYVWQSVTNVEEGDQERDSSADSWLLDAALGYRLPNRRGIVSLELNNLLDQDIHWQDDAFRSSDQQNRRFIPERSVMLRLNLNY
jgi:Flp pilus assembly protein TadD